MAQQEQSSLGVADYEVRLDGQWLLTEFTDLFHYYTEVYSMVFVVSGQMPDARTAELLQRYPWRGGYSAVNFYDDLYAAVGKRARPAVRSIQYASPGHLELILSLPARHTRSRSLSKLSARP